MRILILVDDYLPSTKSGARMIHDLAAQFVCSGHHVTVVVPSSQVQGSAEVSTEEGIRILRVRAGNLKNIPRPLRAWRESRLSATIWAGAKRFFASNAFELIIFYSPSIFFGALVLRLKSLWKCPAYLVLRDIFPKWAVEAGLIAPDGVLHRYFRRKELLQYAAADWIGVEAPGNVNYFVSELAGKYSVEVLFSWMELKKPEPANVYRQHLGLTDKVVFFYGGNIGVAQAMGNVVQLASALSLRNDIFFLLVGEGSEVPRLQAEIQTRQLENIKILPAVPQDDYMKMLSEFDVGLVSLDRRLSSHNLPGKIFGYMNNALPILASVNPGNDLAELLRHSGAGIACESGDDQSFLNAALRLSADVTLRKQMGQNAHQLLKSTFSVSAAATQILSHLTSDHR